MKNNVTLTIASLLSILFMTLHLSTMSWMMPVNIARELE